MTQPSQDVPELPEEEKKTTGLAPVIVQEDKRRYLYEGALIVLSVLLALFLNELRNTWQESRRTEEIIENLRNEITKNKETVEVHYRYLTLVLNNIDSALVNEDYQSELVATAENYFNIQAVAPEGVFNAGFIDEIAWIIAQENNIYAKVDFETISLLSEIYEQQAMIKQGYEMVGEIMASREALDSTRVRETLTMIKYNAYKGYSYDRMPGLLRSYDEALKKLEAY